MASETELLKIRNITQSFEVVDAKELSSKIIEGVKEAMIQVLEFGIKIGKEKNQKETMSQEEAAKVIGISRKTVYNMIKNGELEVNIKGKVTRESVIKVKSGIVKPLRRRRTNKDEQIKTENRQAFNEQNKLSTINNVGNPAIGKKLYKPSW